MVPYQHHSPHWATAAALVVLCIASWSTPPAMAQTTFGTLLDEMIDRDRLAVHPGATGLTSLSQSSSTDLSFTWLGAPTTFANADFSKFIRSEVNPVDGVTEWVMMEDSGPGAITRWWMTGDYLSAGNIRVYIDGATEPVLDGEFRSLLGANAAFGPELSLVSRPGDYSGHNLYAPIPYTHDVKVTYRGPQGKLYYNINYRQYDDDTSVQTYSPGDTTTYAAQLSDATAALANPTVTGHVGDQHTQTATLTAGQAMSHELSGAGAIRRLELNVSGLDQVSALRDTYLELKFDGQSTARIPVGHFFGNGDGDAEGPYNTFEDFYRTVGSDGTMTARWVMPYRSGAAVRIVNEGAQDVDVDLEVDSGDWTWDANSMHFHANFVEEAEINTRRYHGTADFRYLTVRGRGVFVGDTLSLRNGGDFWWGEGDEKVYVDYLDASGVGHHAMPDHFGTGTEDYYGYAWAHTDEFTSAFVSQSNGSGNLAPGRSVNSRVRGLDAIPFEESFKFDMEVWHHRATDVDYAVTDLLVRGPGRFGHEDGCRPGG